LTIFIATATPLLRLVFTLTAAKLVSNKTVVEFNELFETFTLTVTHGWRRNLVVRMSVFGRPTFSALRPIYGWQETTLWVYCSVWVSQLGQLSPPSIRGR